VAPESRNTATSTYVYVVRHAKARDREAYLGKDESRPLSGSGRKQSKAIAKRFEGPVDAVLSSPAVRCMETVAPLAAARGLELGERQWLAEGTPGRRALEMMLVAAEGLSGLVVCSHGDVIWDLLDHLLDMGVELDSPAAAPKASTWELVVADQSVTEAHFRPAP
jgi:broad specificity phosphatase PhoE